MFTQERLQQYIHAGIASTYIIINTDDSRGHVTYRVSVLFVSWENAIYTVTVLAYR